MTHVTASHGPEKAVHHDSRRKLVKRRLLMLCSTIMMVGLLNFALFVAGAFYIGGDAWNGKVQDQKYYVWGYHHGQKGYAEVSRRVFDYSK